MHQLILELEKFLSNVNTLKLIDGSWQKEIFIFQESMRSKRAKDRESNWRIASELYKSIKEISFNVNDPRKLRNIDVQELQEKLKIIEQRIRNFKNQVELNSSKLKDEEKVLTFEIANFERELDKYEIVEGLRIPSIPKPIHIKTYDDLEEESQDIACFDKFLLEHGGHFGGWDEEDHLLYLQYRKKFKTKSHFVENLQIRLPGISEDEILKHDKWYADYLFLKEKQRAAIKKWKVHRKEEKDKQRVKAKEAIHPQRKVNEESMLEKKKRLNEWKQHKIEIKKQEDADAERRKQEELEKAIEKKQLQEMKKTAVEIYRKEKMCQRNSYLLMKELKELKEREERAAQANILLKSFRKNDETYIERRRLWREKLEKNNIKGQGKLKRSVSVEAQRDPSRLLRLTLSWQDRLQSKDNNSSDKPILHLRNMPRLGVPNWRKTLSA
ncbi:hypothetical protein J437_LFUL000321 [Ladona fulva]|uniref:Coiled-coil domain-containing protein 112 n=1 Tax=Ladona fulva TaxID=123851 RepID=A0A8K0NWF0_LADFU|nr:hypothetical protein J437_LFUL000321 [Ladona fulva]